MTPLSFAAQLVMRDGFDEVLDAALACERAGFARVYVPDHFHTASRGGGGGIAEAWTTQAALAARTERIRVGAAVHCNLFRHPCLTAQTVATVDRIAHGRLDFGLGAGWMQAEFTMTGLPFPRPGPRIRMLDEALRIILPALEGRSVTLDGEFYHVRDFALSPGPVQRPRPPLHIGGGGDKVLRLAARYAEIVSLVPPAPHGDIDPAAVRAFDGAKFEERVRHIRNAAELEGRDPADVEILQFAFLCRLTQSESETDQVARGLAGMFGVEPSRLRDHPMALIGTPDQMLASLEERRDRWGIGGVMLAAPDGALAEALGKEVIPRLG